MLKKVKTSIRSNAKQKLMKHFAKLTLFCLSPRPSP